MHHTLVIKDEHGEEIGRISIWGSDIGTSVESGFTWLPHDEEDDDDVTVYGAYSPRRSYDG